MSRKTQTPPTLAELEACLDPGVPWPAKLAGEAGEEQRQLMQQVLDGQLERARHEARHWARWLSIYVDELVEGGVPEEVAWRFAASIVSPAPVGQQAQALDRLATAYERQRVAIVDGDAPIFRTKDPS